MEEPDRSKRFRFPGYDGALPKAMRSSRGRRTYQKKMNQASDDLHCIELLATVAGQVLQSKTMQEVYVVTQNGSVNEIGKADGDIGSWQGDLPSFQVSNFEGPSKMLGMIGKDLGEVMSQDSSKGVCLPNVKNALCSNPIEANVGSCNKEGGSSLENNSLPKGDGSNHAIPPELPEPGYSDTHMHSEGHAESDANCSIFRDRDTREEGSCMSLLRDNSPLPVSSGSSEEAPTHVHKQLCDQCREQPLEGQLDCSQDLVRLNARDDDDNFSNSVVLATTSGQRPSVPMLANGPQIQESQCKSLEEEVSVAVTKRKGLFPDGK